MFSATDLEQDMPILQAILKETLRFHGPVRLLKPRVSEGKTHSCVDLSTHETPNSRLSRYAPFCSSHTVPNAPAVPLSTPITTTDGQVLKSLTIPKGTHLYLDIAGYNRYVEKSRNYGQIFHTLLQRSRNLRQGRTYLATRTIPNGRSK